MAFRTGVKRVARLASTFAARPSSSLQLDLSNQRFGDAKPDIVVASSRTNNASVLLGPGDGTYRMKVDYPTGEALFFVAVADVNRDAKPDIVTANTVANGTVSVLLGNGAGTFRPKVDYAVGGTPLAVAISDVGGDRDSDLVVANEGSGAISILSGMVMAPSGRRSTIR